MEQEVLGVFHRVTVLLLGLCLGSFATALAYRLPRDLSMVSKQRSACPSCGKDLGFIDLIPFFSWAFLRGKCRQCKAAIGWQYPAIELGTLLLCLLFYFHFGFTAQAFCLFALACVLVAMTDIDFRFKIIPDELNIAVFALGVLALIAGAFITGDGPDFVTEKGADALGGMLLYGLGSLALRQGAAYILKREPMGLGDVKFFAAAGFWLGSSVETLAWFLMAAGGLGVVIALVWKKVAKEPEFPFGPALIAAYVIMLFLAPTAFLVKG